MAALTPKFLILMVDALRGRLFVFEGPDDVGKTTLAAMLSEYLLSKRRATQVLSFPGRELGTVSELIYRLYNDPTSLGINEITAIAMQVMVTAAHIEVIEARIKPLITSGVDIVLDRFWWSTWVYATIEGVAPQTRDLLIELEMQSWADLRPEFICVVLRNEPLVPQHQKSHWVETLKLYKELVKLQNDKYFVQLLTNERSPAEALDEIITRLQIA